MKTKNQIPEALVQDVADKISRHKSSKAIYKSIVYLCIAILAGAVTIFGNLDAQSWKPMCFGCIAVIALIMAIVNMFGSKPEYKYNGVKLVGYEIYLNNPSVSAICVALRDKDLKTMRCAINKMEVGMRLNVAIAEDGSLRRMQFFKYVPFEYKPESEIIGIDAETAEFIEGL